MKVSLEWVRDYVELPASLDVKKLAHELTLKTVEVEEWADTAAAVDSVVAARVAGLEPVEGGFRVTCDAGRGEPVVLATRATDLDVGQIVTVAEPGARLAPTATAPAREVGVATVLGIESAGVLCSPRDLGLQGMFPLSRDQVLRLDPSVARPGDALADVLGLNDTVLDIDNKSLTNRPDLWGHYGIARELAAIYGLPLRPLAAASWPDSRDGLVGAVDARVCRRFSAISFDLDTMPETPLWLRSRLARIGENSVNLCVDLSNYVMFTVGQPTHVYDADKVRLPLAVGRADGAAKFEALGGTAVDLDEGTPVVTGGGEPVAIAGVIGGANSGVTVGSRRFLLETASFHGRPVRRTTQQAGLRTEASARFEKGIDTQRVTEAVGLFLRLLREIAPSVLVHGGQDVSLNPTVPTEVVVERAFLSTRIGQDLDPTEVRRTLEWLGFTVAEEDGTLRVTSPTWRSTGDISLPQDILEEVARIHGYDRIPPARLQVPLEPVGTLNRRPLDRVLREQLAARANMQEIVTYPWAADHLIVATGHLMSDTIRIDGAPAPDRASLRPSLVPNLLEAVTANLRFSQAFSVFELGRVFTSGLHTARHECFEALPAQQRMLAGAIVGDSGAALFRRAKGILEMLRHHAHLTDLHFAAPDSAPAWADRLASTGVFSHGSHVGTLGLVSNKARRAAGIQPQAVCFELCVDLLSAHESRENRYEPVPAYPDADFDLSVVVADGVTWHELDGTVRAGHELVHDVAFVDEFRGSWVPPEHRATTLRVTLRSTTGTLTADEIASARHAVLSSLAARHNARLREV